MHNHLADFLVKANLPCRATPRTNISSDPIFYKPETGALNGEGLKVNTFNLSRGEKKTNNLLT